MTNMAIGAIYIGIVLCQAFQVIDCCTFKPFEDSRCYLELVNQQYIVRSNPDRTHIDFTQCILVNGELHNPQSVHRQECDQALSGQTVYVSLNAVHQSAHQTQTSSSHSSNKAISTSGSSSSNSSHSSHHYRCYHNHRYYREIFGEAERVNCHRTYSVFDKLDYLRQHDHYCLSTLVREMAGLKHSDCECSDSSSNIQYSFRGQQYYHHNCMNHPTYKDIITRYLSYVPYNMGVMEPSAKCHTRYQLWQDLLRLQNSEEHHTTCFDQFVHHMNEAYHTHSEPPCSSCHIPAAHTNADHNYNAYIKGDCLSEHTDTPPSSTLKRTTPTSPTTSATTPVRITTTTTTTKAPTTNPGLRCPSECDANLQCVWNQVCSPGEVCMLRQYRNDPFTVHCSKKPDCAFMKMVVGAEITCCENLQCITNILP